MAFFKCKMCGGELELQGGNVAECLYCGSKQTVPCIDNDKKLRLYNRAIQYRLNNEFEKAYSAYETIIAEKEDEPEAYWGLVLSEYGVEYVEDPKTKKRIPTCHRTLIKSVTSNENYKLACKYADGESRMMYEDEAEELDALQKKILTAASKEEPYDIFICYKETDQAGERTADSVLAQEIYEELTKRGYRVFFSRISLEDKLGADYEPCIYAALTSAKVMLVVTTDSEHCNAVWVKNEWKRYLDFMKNDKEKVLIPVYKDISPYALPDDFAKLQAQDMSKLGAVQDLVRGVEKILGKSNSNTQGGLGAHEKQLLEKIERNEKRKSMLLKVGVIGAATILGGMFILGYSKHLTLFYAKGLPIYLSDVWRSQIGAFILMAMAIALDAALLNNWMKGAKSRFANSVYLLLFVLCSIVLIGFGFISFRPHFVLVCAYMLITFIALISTIFTYSKDKKKLFTVTAAIVLLVILSLLSAGITPSQSNKRDESKIQIMVVNDTLNVRASHTTDSEKLTIVNEGDVFDVQGVVETEEYTWYKIETNLGVKGYVAAGKRHEYVKLLSLEASEDQGDERDENLEQIRILDDNLVIFDTASEDGTLVGRVYRDEIYTIGEVVFEAGRAWCEITTAQGVNGYICASTISEQAPIEELLPERSSLASNVRNEDVWQIKVVAEYRNVRAQADNGSEIIAKVKEGDFYDVQDAIIKDGIIWYKIDINSQLEGYVYAADSEIYFESIPANSGGVEQSCEQNSDKEQYRVGHIKPLYENPNETSKVIAVLFSGEYYDTVSTIGGGAENTEWYEIRTNQGLTGYVKAR